MADERIQSGGQDRARINVNDDYEVRYWSHRFNVNPEQVKHAVSVLGSYALDIKHHLKDKQHA